ncbi:MAG: biotin transporter BioY [Anaerolineales bacterium]|nr:MAG: biotin transporter BioY [Anaerolineales bacterium]
MTYVGIEQLRTKPYARTYDVTLIIVASAFVALSAQVAIPLPFSPVPVTLQTLAVLVTGALLGSRRGALCLAVYVLEGAVGLPVFAGWMGGVGHLLGPTGGYLLGFIAAAYVTGLLAERGWDRRVGTCLLAMLVGNIVIYAFGLPWLGTFVGLERALPLGLIPFIAGDVAKLALGALSLPRGRKLLGADIGGG